MALYMRKRRDGTVQVASDPTFTSDPPTTHHFTPEWVFDQVAAGIATLSKGQIVLHADSGDVAYDITREPGAYCSGCGHRVGDGPATTPSQVEARRAESADCCEADADDVEVINYYEGARA